MLEIGSILEIATSYVNGELVLLVPILIWLGSFIKKSSQIADELIPDLLVLAGMPFVFVYNVSLNSPSTLNEWVCLIIVSLSTAIVLGTTAVGVNQVSRQHEKAKLNTMFQERDTEEME